MLADKFVFTCAHDFPHIDIAEADPVFCERSPAQDGSNETGQRGENTDYIFRVQFMLDFLETQVAILHEFELLFRKKRFSDVI